MAKKKLTGGLLAFSLLISTLLLSSCSKEADSRTMFADVILLDISSGMNKFGTFNDQDHSTSSLSSRAAQLKTKLQNALDERHAVYFGFVRKTYGQQQIETLVSPKLIQLIDNVLSEDVKDSALRKDAKGGIIKAWAQALNLQWATSLNQTSTVTQSSCSRQIEITIGSESNYEISDKNVSKIASSLCTNAQTANDQIEGLKIAPENIGSEIQAAVDRSIEKLASDESRLVNKDGLQISLIPTIILVSDLIQVTNGSFILDELKNIPSTDAACKMAEDQSLNYESAIKDINLISDGFASTEGNVNSELREKLRAYWKCWFSTRGIDDPDLGSRGINLGDI